MKKELKEAWIEALRSGEYKQGVGALCEEVKEVKTYCCLGVLADICGPHIDESLAWKLKNGCWALVNEKGEDMDEWHEEDGDELLSTGYVYAPYIPLIMTPPELRYGPSRELSPPLIEKLGLPQWIVDSLIRKNDLKRDSFEMIATFIEENEGI